MPTTPNSDRIIEFFNLDVVYQIPIYQRRYVWDTDNWRALWKDIEDNSEKNFAGNSQNHFTGAVVTQKIQEIGEENLTIYEVIDGQQRLTTFQIIFSALRFLCDQMRDDYDIAGELDDYLTLAPALGGYRKLRPTKYDQDAFYAVVGNNAHVPNQIAEHKIYKAYVYFRDAMTEYVGADYGKLHNLYTSIINNFYVVQIEAEANDKSQKIFETINATGRQLSEFDYLRNNLFLRVGVGTTADAERTRLYNDYWIDEFETHYNKWSDGKLEAFLKDFLLAKCHSSGIEDTRTFDIYRQYSATLDPGRGQGLEYEIRQLRNYGETYRRMNDVLDIIGLRMQFYKDMDISEVQPFILYVISELRPDEDQTENFFNILESYIVQSMLVKAPYLGKIQSFFDRIKAKEHRFLRVDHFQNSLAWPNITQVSEALRQAGTKNKKLIRYILYRIECWKRESEQNVDNPNVEIPSFKSVQSLEHVMPQSWQAHWPLDSTDNQTPEDLYFNGLYTREYKRRNIRWQDSPSADGLADSSARYLNAHKLALNRIKMFQSIGNLTPLSKKLNKHFAHNSFSVKRDFFVDHPARADFVLTREIFYQNRNWDAQKILAREEQLLNIFSTIWPIKTNP